MTPLSAPGLPLRRSHGESATTYAPNFQVFDPKTPLSKAQLLFYSSKKRKNLRSQRDEHYFSLLLVESRLSSASQGDSIKASPALSSDTTYLYFPYLPTSAQPRGGQENYRGNKKNHKRKTQKTQHKTN